MLKKFLLVLWLLLLLAAPITIKAQSTPSEQTDKSEGPDLRFEITPDSLSRQLLTMLGEHKNREIDSVITAFLKTASPKHYKGYNIHNAWVRTWEVDLIFDRWIHILDVGVELNYKDDWMYYDVELWFATDPPDSLAKQE